MILNYNQIGVSENIVCINQGPDYCLEYQNEKIIDIEFFNLIILMVVPVILISIFVSIFKKRR